MCPMKHQDEPLDLLAAVFSVSSTPASVKQRQARSFGNREAPTKRVRCRRAKSEKPVFVRFYPGLDFARRLGVDRERVHGFSEFL